jgi:hypothetical protein
MAHIFRTNHIEAKKKSDIFSSHLILIHLDTVAAAAPRLFSSFEGSNTDSMISLNRRHFQNSERDFHIQCSFVWVDCSKKYATAIFFLNLLYGPFMIPCIPRGARMMPSSSDVNGQMHILFVVIVVVINVVHVKFEKRWIDFCFP